MERRVLVEKKRKKSNPEGYSDYFRIGLEQFNESLTLI
jgi:hypothetical protein